MYTCVKAIVLPRGENTRYSEVQVGNSVLRTLFSENTVVQLVLTHPALDHEVGLNLDQVADLIFKARPETTVDEWLHSLGSMALPVTDTVLKKTVSVAIYNDAFMAEYTLTRVHPTSGFGNEMPEGTLDDILLTKEDIDYKELYESCLVTANGLFHIADYSTAGLKVEAAGQSVRHSNKNSIGLISFREVGKLSFYPLKGEMAKPLKEGNVLNQGFTLAMPDIDLSGKVVMLVLGGVLHLPNDRYRPTGDHSVMIDWPDIPFVQRYYDTNRLIDLSTFDATLSRGINMGDVLDLNQAMRDESIRAYLDLPQSFLILLEADHFYYERHSVERAGLPGRYYSYVRPKFPLQMENGLMPAYVATPEDTVYTIAMDDNLIQRRVHDTRHGGRFEYYTRASRSNKPAYYSAGWLLEMGREYLSE